MKKAISILLVVCVLLSTITVGIVTGSAATISSATNFYRYKEDYVKNYCTYDFLVNKMRLPYRGFVEKLNDDTTFQVELKAWETVTLKPDSLNTYIMQTQQCKYYEGILLDLLVRDTQSVNYVDEIDSLVDSFQISSYKKFVKLNIEQIKAEDEDLGATLVSFMEKEHLTGWNNVLKYAGTISECVGYVKDATDLYYKLCKVELISEMSQSYAEVLKDMSGRCASNIYLKAALNNVSLIFSEDMTTEQIKYIFSSEAGINSVYKEVLSQLKKLAIQELGIYGIALDLAQSAGTAVADEWFGTNDCVTDYYEMRSLYEIEDLLRASVLNTHEETFCSAFKMYENICLLGCDYSKKYVEPLYNSAFGKIFAWATNQNYEAYVAELDKLKNNIEFSFEMIELGAASWYVIDSENYENMQDLNSSYIYNLYEQEEYIANTEDIACDVLCTYGNSLDYDMKLKRDVVVYSDFSIIKGKLELNGNTLIIDGNLTQDGGVIDINSGELEIKNNFNQYAGTVKINKGVLDINNDYLMKRGENKETLGVSSGCLIMNDSEDVVKVEGDFITVSTRDHSEYLTDGTMYIKGDFSQHYPSGYSGSSKNFNATNNHKIVFNGSDEQRVFFESGSSGMCFVDFVNKNIKFDGKIRGWTFTKDVEFSNDIFLPLYGELNLNGYNLTVNGDITQKSGTINLNNGFIKTLNYYLEDEGKIDINGGELKINNNFNQYAGTVKINKGVLDINNDYLMKRGEDKETLGASGGSLIMNDSEDVVKVEGDFITVSTRDHSEYLTDGTMYIKGDFSQHYISGYSGSSKNFNATNNHKIVFNGSDEQNVYFSSVDSRFSKVIIFNDIENVLFYRNYCWNKLMLAINGDSNLDETVSISDVTVIQSHLAELTKFTDEQLVVADTNGDGKVDIDDATHLQKYIAEFDGIVLGKA